MINRWNLLVCGCAVGFLACPAYPLGTIPDYNFDWVVIGDPGNPGFEGGPAGQLAGRGSLDYEYRMTRTEVMVSQWFEFVQAFAPYAGDEANSFGFTGFFINLIGPAGIPSSYQITPGAENLPTNMNWRMAARYVNWLHNDKENSPESFAMGVYDTSTFTQNKDGTFNDQPTHSPDAKFWIPTLDEWLKAVYYDPTLNAGAGGWWHHPASSDNPLIAGLPWQAGQTNATLLDVPGLPNEVLDVGSYPVVHSPWGLLDASGGMREWTEKFSLSNGLRHTKGSSFFSDEFSYQWEDDILTVLANSVLSSGRREGLRVASQVSRCPTDVNGDGVTNVLDLIDLLLRFGLPSDPPCNASDINGDGETNNLDLILLLDAFGATCP